MYFPIACISLFVFNFSCIAQEKQDVAAIEIFNRLQLYGGVDSVITLDETNPIYFYDSLRIFLIPYGTIEIINDSLAKEETKYQYLICKRSDSQDKTGILYDMDAATHTGRKVLVDSAIKGSLNPDFPWHKAIQSFRLYKTIYNSDKTGKQQIYLPADSTVEEDTMRLYFSKTYDQYDYSFSKTLDSMHRMKLTKIHYEYLAGYSREFKAYVPHRDIIFEMKETTVADKKKLKQVLDIYQKEMHHGK